MKNNTLAHKVDDETFFSFDLFDTIVTRRTCLPNGIFSLMQKELKLNPAYDFFGDYIKENFFKIRVQAQDFLLTFFCSENNREISIEKIYDFFLDNGYVKNKQERDLLLDLELHTELKNILPIHKNIDEVTSLIKSGKNVAIITDTYFSIGFLRQLLNSAAPELNNIKIYASSFYGKTKRHGDIWEFVKIREKIEYTNWVHMGDNWAVDCDIPTKLGIFTKLYVPYPYMDWENIIYSNANNPDFQLAIGAARYTLIEKQFFNDKYLIGAAYAGCMLLPYVSFLIDHAIAHDISDLYFIARDGYLLEKIAKIILSNKKCDIKTHYIYGSRAAWRCSTFNDKQPNFSYVFDEFWLKNTLSKFAERLHISVQNLIRYLPTKYASINVEKCLKQNEISAIKKCLLEQRDFKEFIIDENKKRIERVKEYFTQEIDFSKNFAFVDLQGTGTTQTCLAQLLKDLYAKKIKTYYFYTGKYNSNNIDIKISAFPNVHLLNFFLECFCRAPHGQTLDYRTTGGKIVPILDKEDSFLKEYDYDSLVSGVLDYTKLYITSAQINNLSICNFELFDVYFRYAFERPCKKFASIIGDIPFSLSESVTKKELLAPKIVWNTIFKYLIGYRNYSNMPHLSKARSKHKYVRLINFLEKYWNLEEIFCLKTKNNKTVFRILGIPFFKIKYKYQQKKEYYVLGIKLINQVLSTNDKLYYSFFGIKFWCTNPVLKIIKEYTSKIDCMFDNAYLLQITNMGECYLFCTLFKKICQIHHSKKPVIFITKKIYKDIISMMLPNMHIEMIYTGIDVLLNCTKDVYTTNGHKIFIPFTLKYLTSIEKKFNDKNIHYFTEMEKHLGISPSESITYLCPHVSKNIEYTVEQKICELSLNKSNFVILCPEASTCAMYSQSFWNKLVAHFLHNNIDVFLNIIDQRNYINGTKSLFLNIDELVYLSRFAKRIIGIRSGILEILSSTHTPIEALYTYFPLQKISATYALSAFTLKKIPNIDCHNIFEYNTDCETEEYILQSIITHMMDFEKSTST